MLSENEIISEPVLVLEEVAVGLREDRGVRCNARLRELLMIRWSSHE